MNMNRAYMLFFSVTSILYCVLELLLGNLDVPMTDISLGTSRQSKTHHISHSCGHTAVFLVLLGVTRLCCHALLSFSFRFHFFSGGAILYPELDDIIGIFWFWLQCVLARYSNLFKTWTAFNATESGVTNESYATFCSVTHTHKQDSSDVNDDLSSFVSSSNTLV